MNKAVNQCPVCASQLVISRLTCNKCGTAIEGTFGHGLFSNLSDEEARFMEIFIICRGNIKEVEKRLGVSYPTVRNKLDNLVAKLDYTRAADPDARRKRRIEIIDSIKRGDITPEEAALLMEEI